jgi:hypothetical protein
MTSKQPRAIEASDMPDEYTGMLRAGRLEEFSADFDPTRNYLELSAGRQSWGRHWRSCSGQTPEAGPTPTIPDPYRRVEHSDVETLMISGNLDSRPPPNMPLRSCCLPVEKPTGDPIRNGPYW